MPRIAMKVWSLTTDGHDGSITTHVFGTKEEAWKEMQEGGCEHDSPETCDDPYRHGVLDEAEMEIMVNYPDGHGEGWVAKLIKPISFSGGQ